MFHGKPWHFAAFFILMPLAVLFSNKMGWGTNGLFVSILVVVGVVAAAGWWLKRLGRAFRSRGEALEFLMSPMVPMQYLIPGGTHINEEDEQEAPDLLATPSQQTEAVPPLPVEQWAAHRVSGPHASLDRLNLAPDLQPHADEVLSGRISIFGVSGSGKSNTVAVLCEEIARFGVPFILADTEDEYSLLCQGEWLPRGYLAGSVDALKTTGIPRYLAVNAEGAFAFGQAVLAQGLQVILNLQSYQTDEEAALVMISIIGGMRAWEEQRQTEERVSCMFLLEEASVWLPQNASESTLSRDTLARLQQAFFATVVRRGRKRGIGFIFATQRIAEMDKRAMSCSWTILHRQTLDVDLQRYEKFSIEPEQAMGLSNGEAFIFSPMQIKTRSRFRLRYSPDGARTPGLESVRRHRTALRQASVPLDAYTFAVTTPPITTAPLSRQAQQYTGASDDRAPSVLSSDEVEQVSSQETSTQNNNELDRALQAWKNGHQSVRKLQHALGVSQYQAYDLYRKLKERRVI